MIIARRAAAAGRRGLRSFTTPGPRPPSQAHVLHERDVGVDAFLAAHLPPIHATIKQRFSDFQVREIRPDGTLCRLTADDLLPPEGPLRERLAREQQEHRNPALAAERRNKEAEARSDRHVQAQAALTLRQWPVEARTRLAALGWSEQEIESLRHLWLSGDKQMIVLCHTPVLDRQQRGRAHQAIRELFHGHLTSSNVRGLRAQEIDPSFVCPNDIACLPKVDGNAPQPFLTVYWPKSTGERAPVPALLDKSPEHPPYISFLMQKSNRDLYDAAGLLTRHLGMLHRSGTVTKALSFAGTKDKRAVTTQAVVLKRGKRTLEEVYLALNKVFRLADSVRYDRSATAEIRSPSARADWDDDGEARLTILDAVTRRAPHSIRVGRFAYTDKDLRLGDLNGNQFVVTLRNVSRPGSDTPSSEDKTLFKLVETSIASLRQNGCINYFGMQRFGTTNIPTYSVGVAIFKGDYQRAVELIMAERITDNPATRHARQLYCQGELQRAYFAFPRSYVSECAIVGRMIDNERRGRKHNWFHVLHSVTRNMRIIFCHSYQSLIWNRLVSLRLQRGLRPLPGDFVLANSHAPKKRVREESTLPEVKRLTESDVGQYKLEDVLMPMPGTNVKVPAESWVGQTLKELYAQDGMTEELTYSSDWKEYRMRGFYRFMVVRPENLRARLVRYTDPEMDLALSDEDAALVQLAQRGILGPTPPPLTAEKAAGQAPPTGDMSIEGQGPFLALQIVMELPVGTYATMALRELLRSDDTSPQVQRLLTLTAADRKYRGLGPDAHLDSEVAPQPTQNQKETLDEIAQVAL